MENEILTMSDVRVEIRTYLSIAVGVFWVGIAAITIFASFLQNLLNKRHIREETKELFEVEKIEFELKLNRLRSDAMYSLALGFVADKNYALAVEFYIYAAKFYCMTNDYTLAKGALERANTRAKMRSMKICQIPTSKMIIIASTIENFKNYTEELGEDLVKETENNFIQKFKLMET